jgi:LacI family transcriptional regulator
MLKDRTSKNRPTLKTIASLTGLGVSTVSRALQNGPEISENTKRRVREMAQQLGYQPDRAGVRLRTGKTNVINLIIDTDVSIMGVVTGLIGGISDVLEGTPYHLVVTPHSTSDPLAPVHRVVETRSADGIIFSRIEPEDARVKYLLDQGVPFATHGRTEMGLVHPYHDYDNEAFARMAVQALVRRGRRRIGFLGPLPKYTFWRHLRRGFESALAEARLEEVLLENVTADSPLSVIKDSGEQLAARADRPDGILASGLIPSLALAHGMRLGGMVTGKDVDVVTKRYTDIATLFSPDVICIDEDFRVAGRNLARAVLAWIDGADPAGLQTLDRPVPDGA